MLQESTLTSSASLERENDYKIGGPAFFAEVLL